MRDIDLKLEKEWINRIKGSKENHIIEITNYIQDKDEDQEPIEEPWKIYTKPFVLFLLLKLENLNLRIYFCYFCLLLTNNNQ